jgi:tRNA(Ile)-lysidine synthase
MRLRRLEPVLRRALRGPCRLPKGSRLLVAVSGGADSTALLAALVSVAREFELSLSAAHLHHGLRGAEADGDLAHVRDLCVRFEVPLLAARWNTRDRMRREGLSGEAGLRTLRRRFLLAAARRAGAAAIATAHTADDQLETVLMRLARGTGLAGLGGMRPRHGRWLKPLLEATRHDAERDLEAARITWREDSSNAGRAWLRNRLRHDVVPALVAAIAGPGAAPHDARGALARRVAAAATEARAGARVIGRHALAVLERRRAAGGAGFGVRGWSALPLAIRNAVLARAWKLANPRSSGLPRRHRDALDGLLSAGRRRAQLTLPEGWRAVLAAGRLELKAPAPGARPPAGSRATLNRAAANTRTDARLPSAGARRASPVPGGPDVRASVTIRRRARSHSSSR